MRGMTAKWLGNEWGSGWKGRENAQKRDGNGLGNTWKMPVKGLGNVLGKAGKRLERSQERIWREKARKGPGECPRRSFENASGRF